MTELVGLNRRLIRSLYPELDWDEYDREVVAEMLPDYEAAVDALERIRQKMSDWQDATQAAGVYRDSAPDARVAKWVHDEAFDALRRLRGES